MNTNNGRKIALLILDIQNKAASYFNEAKVFIGCVNSAIKVARKANISVLFTGYKFREGAPEISKNNKLFSGITFLFANPKEGDNDVYKGLDFQKQDFDILKNEK